MKLLKIANLYNTYYNYYYKKFPDIKNKSYTEQYDHLMQQYPGWADFYSNALKKLGIEAYEIIYNATYILRQWANENNVKGNNLEILNAMILKIKPDIIWFQDSFSFDSEFMNSFRDKIPNLKLLIGNCCSPYTLKNLENLKIFDFVTTCSPQFVHQFENYGLKTLLLYHAFEPSILPKISSDKRIRDMIFIGSIIPRKNYHIKRKYFLEDLAAVSNINFSYFGNLSQIKYSEVLKQQILYLIKEFLLSTKLNIFFKNSVKYKKMENLDSFPKLFSFSKAIKNVYKGELYGIDMYKELAKSKITIDIQGEISGQYAGSMRIFESTGCGTCLLIENKKNVKDIFVPDEEVIVYNSFEEAKEKIVWLLNNENKLQEIAKAGQKRTLKEHNYDKRANYLVEEINKYLKK